jgi:hypothetical protein
MATGVVAVHYFSNGTENSHFIDICVLVLCQMTVCVGFPVLFCDEMKTPIFFDMSFFMLHRRLNVLENGHIFCFMERWNESTPYLPVFGFWYFVKCDMVPLLFKVIYIFSVLFSVAVTTLHIYAYFFWCTTLTFII